jgi:hypothetical protein
MPFRRFRIDTLATPNTIIERLRPEVRPEPGFEEYLRNMWKSKKPEGPVFIGRIDGNTFRIRQVVRGRNSFIPLIKGCIEPTRSGTRIDVTMFMHPFVFTFTLFWLGACAWGIWANPFEAPLLIMFVFGATLSIGGFYWEAAKAERLLFRTVADSISSGHQRQTA